MRRKPADWHPLQQQFRRLLPTLVGLYVLLLSVLAGMALYAAAGEDVETLTRDPLAVVEQELLKFQQAPQKSIHTFALLHLPWYTGIVSHLGILLWCASLTLSLFGWRQSLFRQHRCFSPSFLLSLGLLTTIFLVEDIFQVHERVLPRYVTVPDVLLLSLLASGFLLQGLLFRREILNSDYLLLVLALACFALSISVDFLPRPLGHSTLLEEGTKFAGIVHWTGYLWRTASTVGASKD